MKSHATITINTSINGIDPHKFVVKHPFLYECQYDHSHVENGKTQYVFNLTVDTTQTLDVKRQEVTVTHPDYEVKSQDVNVKTNKQVYLVIRHTDDNEARSSLVESIDAHSAWGKVATDYEAKYGLSEDEDVYLEHVKSLAELHEESGIALVKAN